MRIAVVGSGIFGVTSARELRARGHDVWLLDPGPVPHPDAASTDISKVIRADYGRDEHYTDMMEHALPSWRGLNASWERPLFHETGFVVLSSEAMAPGGFEHDSFATLGRRGHRLERLHGGRLQRRYPMWSARMLDGYYNPQGGWAESGAVVAAHALAARRAGVAIIEGARVTALIERGARVEGVVTDAGARVLADMVVVAAGAWTTRLLPELGDRLTIIGQPVFHFAPERPKRFVSPHFVPWAADIARTGWYGFSANADGVVKVANHGPGTRVDPDAPRRVASEWEERFRTFLAEHLPELADARLVGTRLCLYCDSFDGDLWIARHPERDGLVVAAGGSGHGFKFAPLLGPLVADAVEGAEGPWSGRFAWRARGASRFEDARFGG